MPMAPRPASSMKLDYKVLRAMLFYIDEFPERVHHPKESELLFPILRNRGAVAAKVLERLDRDHATSQHAVRDLEHQVLALEMMENAADFDVRRSRFEAATEAYVTAYLDHMSEEVKERAFEPFFTTKPPGRGTGLGLSTVYGFVKQSRGALRVDSEAGAGTTLTLYLPAQEATSAVASAPGEAQAIPVGLDVLLVEDDAEVRAVIRKFLDGFGCRVTEAASGEQALLELSGDFALLLSDIALGPGIRGTELAARVGELSPRTAILLMSGFSSELLEADRVSPPTWELLRKPCSREELAAAIANVLSSSRPR